MNASLQALRSIPELKTALTSHTPNSTTSSGAGGDARLTTQLRSLFNGMDQTTEAIPPYMFLQTLRTIAPQFAEQSQHGGYAQQGALRSSRLFMPSHSCSFIANLVCWLGGKTFLRRVDADEMWTQTVSALHNSLRSPNAGGESSRGSFVDDYLSADLQQTYVGRLSCLPFRQGGAIHSMIAYRTRNMLYDIVSQADLRRSPGRAQERQDGQGPQARL